MVRPFPAASAFGGLAVYRSEVVRDCRYDSGPYDDCEHVSFHACVAARLARGEDHIGGVDQAVGRAQQGTQNLAVVRSRSSTSDPSLTSEPARDLAPQAALGVVPRLVVVYDLPCDPGPGVDLETGCFSDRRVRAQMEAFSAKRAELLNNL